MPTKELNDPLYKRDLRAAWEHCPTPEVRLLLWEIDRLQRMLVEVEDTFAATRWLICSSSRSRWAFSRRDRPGTGPESMCGHPPGVAHAPQCAQGSTIGQRLPALACRLEDPTGSLRQGLEFAQHRHGLP